MLLEDESSVLVEAVPNFSVLRKEEVEEVSTRFRLSVQDLNAGGADSCKLLDVHFDADHQRSVWTLAGTCRGLMEGLQILTQLILPSVDMRKYSGVHPAMGALDVLPLVLLSHHGSYEASKEPLSDVPLSDVPLKVFEPRQFRGSHAGGRIRYQGPQFSATPCGQEKRAQTMDAGAADERGYAPIFACTRDFAAWLWKAFGVPSYFYGMAATSIGRRELPSVRKPFGLLESYIAEGHLPDVGDPSPHRVWGASAIGIRRPLVAFNILLDTGDIAIGRRIAARLRDKRDKGELPGIRALAFYLPSKSAVQISLNLTEPARLGVAAAFRAVQREAGLEGAAPASGEVVGLVPRVALEGCTSEIFDICPGLSESVLEDRLRSAGLELGEAPIS
jgi:glutamate formiminotransferase